MDNDTILLDMKEDIGKIDGKMDLMLVSQEDCKYNIRNHETRISSLESYRKAVVILASIVAFVIIITFSAL